MPLQLSIRSRRTERPGVLLGRALAQEEPPWSLKYHISLERGHALVHRRKLVVVSGAKRRALRGVIGVQLEKREEGHLRRAGEIELLHIGAELFLSSAMMRANSSQSRRWLWRCRHLRYVVASGGEDGAFVKRVA